MSRSVRIDVDVSMHESLEVLKNVIALQDISCQVNRELAKKEQVTSSNTIAKACKNAVSLLFSRKKQQPPRLLTVYIPQNALKSIRDNVVPNSSDDSSSRTSRSSSGEGSTDETDSDLELSSSVSSKPLMRFSMKDDVLAAEANFEYLSDFFKYTLSNNIKPMNIDRMIDDICVYLFMDLHCSVQVKVLRREAYRQLSYIVQAARTACKNGTCIKLLRQRNLYSFIFKSICRLRLIGCSSEFNEYRGDSSPAPILLIRDNKQKRDMIQIFPIINGFEITLNRTWIERILASFDMMKVLDVHEPVDLIFKYCSQSNAKIDLDDLEETLKTEIIHIRTMMNDSKFLTIRSKSMNHHDVGTSNDDLECFSQETIDAIIGRTYQTRGIKRSYVEDPISLEPNRNIHREIELMKQKRDLLHLKDTYHLTDSAFNAVFRYLQNKNRFFSLGEIERLRKKTNAKFPIISTKTSAYVKFAHAVRTAVFVAQKYQLHLDQHDTLTIRFNMDGTLIGNKHIVAISINCIEGGLSCQTAKNLIPLGLFEVQKENTAILRKSLPAEFISDIKNLKYISIGGKDFRIHLRLGGDLMNAVYVFGLSGFSSNHPCVFCTQHKDDLHVTDDTEYDKVITEGKGRNKKTTTVRITATSYHDVTRKARSLVQQTASLEKGNNDLGYKCEPLFDDLFDYQAYCVDTLHMKLRVFDVLLKDILSYASRTGKYGAEHVAILERKIEILNRHCESTVGKRFFFQIDSDDKCKTIASHGKLSGHLQDLFFIDSFPYENILDKDIAKSARTVVNKFRELLKELKSSSNRNKANLKRLSLDFVKEFRQSGLRTTVTPYIHIIGNHLFEFDEMEDLSQYNMQGVEKNNDLLSRLYFSSTNPAKNPLLTMLQKLYRLLEMNFENENERKAMNDFAQRDVYDFIEVDHSSIPDHSVAVTAGRDHDQIGQSSFDDLQSDEEEEQESSDENMTWSPEKRLTFPLFPRSVNRFKSFRRD